MGRQIVYFSVFWVVNYQTLRTTGLEVIHKWRHAILSKFLTSPIETCFITMFKYYISNSFSGCRRSRSLWTPTIPARWSSPFRAPSSWSWPSWTRRPRRPTSTRRRTRRKYFLKRLIWTDLKKYGFGIDSDY